MNTVRYTDNTNDRLYFSTIPNIVFDICPKPHDIAVYIAMLRCARTKDRECFASTKTLAKMANVSSGQVSESKKTLTEFGFIEFNGKIQRNGKGKKIDHYSLPSLWKWNMDHYHDKKDRSPHEQHRSPHETEKYEVRSTNKHQTTNNKPKSKPMRRAQKKISLKGCTRQEVVDLHNKHPTNAPPGISRPQILAAILDNTNGFFGIVQREGWKTIMIRLGQLYNGNRKVTLPHELLMQVAIDMDYIPKPKGEAPNLNYLVAVLTRETQKRLSDQGEMKAQEDKESIDEYVDKELDKLLEESNFHSVYQDVR